MSETTSAPQGEAASTPAEPAATETTAPVEQGAATDTTTDATEEPKPSRLDRRVAVLTARLSAGDQERARLAAENEAYRRQVNPEPVKPVTVADIPRLVSEGVTAEVQRREAGARVETFHEAGKAAYPDWNDRCASLMQMGADAGLAELLVDMPDGAKVAATLADEPDELERIAALKTERARAIALGKYSAELATRPATPARAVSQAPAPIKPLQSGTARTVFNESTATPAQLVEHYSKQAMAKRGL